MTKTEKRLVEIEARLAATESEIKLLQRLMPGYRAWKFQQGRPARRARRELAARLASVPYDGEGVRKLVKELYEEEIGPACDRVQ
jgi:hypothetical protein